MALKGKVGLTLGVKLHGLKFGCDNLGAMMKDFWDNNPSSSSGSRWRSSRASRRSRTRWRGPSQIDHISSFIDSVTAMDHKRLKVRAAASLLAAGLPLHAERYHVTQLLEVAQYGRTIGEHNVSELIDLGDESDPPGKYAVPRAHLHAVLSRMDMHAHTKKAAHETVGERLQEFVQREARRRG